MAICRLRFLIIILNLSLYKGTKLTIKPCHFIAGTIQTFLLIVLERMWPSKTLRNLLVQFNDLTEEQKMMKNQYQSSWEEKDATIQAVNKSFAECDHSSSKQRYC